MCPGAIYPHSKPGAPREIELRVARSRVARREKQ